MKKKLKELIDNATEINSGCFNEFLFIPNGRYDGFWGTSGFDNIIILAREQNVETFYKLCDGIDVFFLENLNPYASLLFDIPSELGVLRLFSHTPISIDYPVPISQLTGYMTRENNWKEIEK